MEPEVVRQTRELLALGWGAKRISRELGIARNTVRRYQREIQAAEAEIRPRELAGHGRSLAEYATVVEGAAPA